MGVTAGRHLQGNSASGWEGHLRSQVSGAAKFLGNNQFDRFSLGQQPVAILAGQGGQ
jgi:hypothetical protein